MYFLVAVHFAASAWCRPVAPNCHPAMESLAAAGGDTRLQRRAHVWIRQLFVRHRIGFDVYGAMDRDERVGHCLEIGDQLFGSFVLVLLSWFLVWASWDGIGRLRARSLGESARSVTSVGQRSDGHCARLRYVVSHPDHDIFWIWIRCRSFESSI